MFSTFTEWVDSLLKAAGHKYIKRIPYTSGGKTRYRYIYKVTHTAGGKHVLDPDHMIVGAAFQLEPGAGKEVHAHITKVDGDMVTYRLDDGPNKGTMVTESKAALAKKLNEKHGVHAAISAERDKQAKVVADLKAAGASTKQIAREQARLERLEAALPAPAPAPKSEEPKKRAAKKPKSAEPKSEEPTGEEAKSAEPKGKDDVLDVLFNIDAPENKEIREAMTRVMGELPSAERIKENAELERIVAGGFPYSLLDGHVTLGEFKDGITVALRGGDPIRIFKPRRGFNMQQVISALLRVGAGHDINAYRDAVYDVERKRHALAPSTRLLRSVYKDAKKVIESEKAVRDANITQGEVPVQKTTAEFASEAAIPKSLQSALNRFVSKDKARPNMLAPFRVGEHLYATDGYRLIRVGVQSTPDKEGNIAVDRVFASAQANTPTATLDRNTARAIVALCRRLDAIAQPVLIETSGGKTRFSVAGNVFATVDAHAERAPSQSVNPHYLADMLSVEQPVTILQHPEAHRESKHPLSAHTASTQQLLMPRSY